MTTRSADTTPNGFSFAPVADVEPGAVRGIDPTTGHYYDDTKRYIEASKILSADDKYQIYEGNVRRVFPRLDARLKSKGL